MEVESKQLYFFIILTALSLKINATPVTEDETPPMNTTLGVGGVGGAQPLNLYPNIIWVANGVDIAKKNPFKDESNRGIPIFDFEETITCKNEYLDFVAPQLNIECSSATEQTSWGSYKEYSESSSASSMKSFAMGWTAPDITFSLSEPSGVASIDVTPVPSSVNVGNGNTDSTADMAKFFNQEGGSVSRCRFACDIYDVTINIADPSLKLTPGFIDHIKRIDLAPLELQKAVMQEFIDKYGTHYAKKSKMGVGMEFETRYSREETKDQEAKLRNSCSSESGGWSYAGIGKSTQSNKCSAFSDGETNWKSSSVKRTEHITYGVLPSKDGYKDVGAWGEGVRNMWSAGILAPKAVEQELEPIYKILLTDKVKEIVHDDGKKTPLNRDNVVKTAVKYYSQYCTVMAGKDKGECDFPACPKTVKLDGNLYHETNQKHNGRIIYEDNVKRNRLSYHEADFTNEWRLTPSNEPDNIIMRTAPCPQKGGKFKLFDSASNPDPNYPKTYTSSSWSDCSQMCLNDDKCTFWQHHDAKCQLMVDYDDIEDAKDEPEDYIIGSRDCPGDSKALQSSFGQCPNTFKAKSMWIKQGETFFKKHSSLEAVCANSCGQGSCNEYGSCTCNDGFSGTDCSIPDCDAATTCSGHGSCTKEGSCSCNGEWMPEFAGNDCSIDLDGCSNYQILDDPKRNKKYSGSQPKECDHTGAAKTSADWKGGNFWYRFKGPAGTQLADSVVPPHHCGTNYSGWLNGAHPVNLGQTVIRKVCFNWSRICRYSEDVKIKKCLGFYIYKFAEYLPTCNSRYCGQD